MRLPEPVDGQCGCRLERGQPRLAVRCDGIVERLILVEFAGEFRVAVGEERVVLTAQVSAIRAGAAKALAVSGQGGQIDRAGQVARADAEVLADGRDPRVVAPLGEVILAVVAPRESGQDGVRVVAVVGVRNRPDQGRLVHPAGEPRQVLADLKARNAGGDRPELTPDLGGRVRLHVEHVEVAGPAEQVHEDDRPGPGCWPSRSPGGRLEQARKRHRAEERQPADSQYLAPAGSITGGRSRLPGFVAWQPRSIVRRCQVSYGILNFPSTS